MHFIFLDILPICLIAVSLYGIKPVKPITSFNKDYNSLDTCGSLRGLVALVVVFHHLAGSLSESVLFYPFDTMAPILNPVGLFFFYSGFGLQKSYIKSSSYKNHFLMRRLPPILLPYAVVTVLFWIMNAVNGTVYSFKDIIMAIAAGDPIVSYSWYIIDIIVFYVIFWLLMVFFGSSYKKMIFAACIWYVLHIVFCRKMMYGPWWYNTSHMLIVGMVWAVYEKEILEKIQKHYRFIAPVVWIFLAVLFIIDYSTSSQRLLVSLSLHMLRVFLVVISLLLFTMKFRIGNPILAFLGKISLEIYLLHGLFIECLRGEKIYIHNDILWSLLAVFGSIALGTVINYLLRIPLAEIKKRTMA